MIVDELIAVLGYDLRGEAALARFNAGMDRTQSRAAAFAAGLAKAGAVAGAAFGAGMVFLGKSVIDTSAEFQTYQATLETLEGSSEKAKASLDWISQFGKTTPYEVSEVTQAFVRLKAYGLDPMDGTLKAVGDAGSAMGKSLMSGVEAIADAVTGENERLKEFGIRAEVAGDQVTYSWTENGKTMRKTIKKDGVIIGKTLKEIFGRFDGAMDKQSKTWLGMTSNMGDNWTDFKRRIGDAGLFDFVSRGMQSALDKIAELDANGSLDRWAQRISDGFVTVLSAIGTFADRVATHGAFIADWLSSLDSSTLWAIAAAFGAWMLVSFPLSSAIIAIAAALDDLLTYLEGGESKFGALVGWIKETTGASDALAASIAAVTAAIGALMALRALGVLKAAAGWAVGAAGAVGGAVAGGAAGAAGAAVTTGTATAAGAATGATGAGLLAAFSAAATAALAAASLNFAQSDFLKTEWEKAHQEWQNAEVKAAFPLPADIDPNESIFTGLSRLGGKIAEQVRDALKEPNTGILPDPSVYPSVTPDGKKETFTETGPVKADGVARPIISEFLDAAEQIKGVFNGMFSPDMGFLPDPAKYAPKPAGNSFDAMRDGMDAPKPQSSITSDAATANAGGGAIRAMLENMNANLARMTPENAVNATVTDARQDNRQFPVSTSVTVNQTVTQMADAPGAAAQATGAAVGQAATAQASRIEAGPAF